MGNLIKVTTDQIAAGAMANVIVYKGSLSGKKHLKVCKLNSRSVLFIEVDKVNRNNTFRKFKVKDIAELGMDSDDVLTFVFKDNVMPDKWESSWDSIGSYSPMTQSKFGTRYFSNHSKGWSATIRPPKGASMDALAVAVSTRSTTNSPAGFPMV